MKKHLDKAVILLGQWFGIDNPFSSAFETYGGTTGKAVDLINGFVVFGALVAVSIMVYGGYRFIDAGGDAEKIDEAKHMITTSIIGLMVVFTAGLIIRFLIERLF